MSEAILVEAVEPSLTKLFNNIQPSIDQVQNVHWNVKGKSFDNIHADSGAIYSFLLDMQDVVAERIKALDPAAPVSKSASVAARVPTNEEECIKLMMAALKNVSSDGVTFSNKVTDNMMQGYQEQIEKWLWKLTNSL